jgi:catechol 2,3-dioxygenase-like lactoylglutathione lyase family enzyme
LIAVERTDFMSVPVTDIERSTRFYEETLGLSKNPKSGGWPEFETGNVSLYLIDPTNMGQEFRGPNTAPIALRVPDVQSARATLEQAGIEFDGEIVDTGVCHMAFLRDPDGNPLLLHRRYAPAHG